MRHIRAKSIIGHLCLWSGAALYHWLLSVGVPHFLTIPPVGAVFILGAAYCHSAGWDHHKEEGRWVLTHEGHERVTTP